jgi:hypothetical protein
MKVEKLVRITAKSDVMDIVVVMTDKKATPYLKRLNRIQGGRKNFSFRIEPAGEILN